MAVAGAGPVERLFTNTRPGLALARRFVAGDTLDDAVRVAKRLNDDGFLVSFDLLGEDVHDRNSALAATDRYLECLDRIDGEHLDANISVKPTQLGLSMDEGLASEAIERLADEAASQATTVTIDMEDSRYTEATISLFEKGQASRGNLGIAVQSCMRRTPMDLERIMPLGGHIRLCKGAYVEPAEVAYPSKHDVDSAFAAQLRTLMLSSTTKPAIATHDDSLIELARSLAITRAQPFEFQMLFGVRPDLQRRLVTEGFPLRVYLPFGSQWYPYLTRRLSERPANAMFLAKALFKR